MRDELISYQKGAAITTAVFVMMVLLLLGETIFIYMKTSNRSLLYESQKTRALYIAEGGIAKALWYLKGNERKDLNWRVKGHSEQISHSSSGTVVLDIQDDGKSIVITSKGLAPGIYTAAQTVRAKVRLAMPEAFGAAVYSEGFLRVDSSQAQVRGNVLCRDRVYVVGSRPDLIKASSFAKVKLPEIDSKEYDGFIKSSDQSLTPPVRADKEYSSSQNFTKGNLPDFSHHKRIYVNGDISFSGGNELLPIELSGPGTIMASGKVTLSDMVTLQNEITLIAKGGIVLKKDAYINGGVLYSPESIELKDNARVRGTIYGRKQIKISGNASVMGTVYTLAALSEGSLLGLIALEGNGTVNGSVIADYDQYQSHSRNNLMVKIGRNAIVNGVVYSKNEVQIEGKINGSVVTKSFHGGLLDKGVIDRTQMPEDFALPDALEEKENKRFEIVSWEKL